MAYTTLNSLLTAIADAIRNKKGTTAQINAQNFPSEIASISTTPKEQSLTKRLTVKGEITAEFTFNELTTVYGVKEIYRADNGLPFCRYQVIKRCLTSDNNVITINGNTVSFRVEELAGETTQADWTVIAVGK